MIQSGTFDMSFGYSSGKNGYYSLNGSEWEYVSGSLLLEDLSAGDKISIISTTGMQFLRNRNMTANVKVYGNAMSLLCGEEFANSLDIPENKTFTALFSGLRNLIYADKLLLPATGLTEYAYQFMFESCTNLVSVPKLPATNLSYSCYDEMFVGCSSLTTAPELPATTLSESCYQGMFSGCTSLVTAPELPAEILTVGCYSYMFSGCTSLNYIKCLATDISASACLNNWVYGVASSGTFVKNPAMTSWPSGDSGIPNNWTVQNV